MARSRKWWFLRLPQTISALISRCVWQHNTAVHWKLNCKVYQTAAMSYSDLCQIILQFKFNIVPLFLMVKKLHWCMTFKFTVRLEKTKLVFGVSHSSGICTHAFFIPFKSPGEWIWQKLFFFRWVRLNQDFSNYGTHL